MQMSDNDNGGDSFVPFEEVKKYVLENVPILPLKEDGLPNTYDLYTPDKLEPITNNLSEFEVEYIFKDPAQKSGLKLVNLLTRQNPVEFWTDKKIRRQKWYAIASLAGPTTIPSKTDPTKILLFIQIDADNAKPKTIIKRIFEKRGYFSNRKTIVQDTPRGGLHGVIAIPIDPNNQQEELELWKHRFLRPTHCKPGCIIEIKTWFGGQITLDPSRYRKDRSKFYQNTSGYKGVLEEDPIVYDLLISQLKGSDCLRYTPEEAWKQELDEAEEDTKYGNDAANVSDEDRQYNDPSDIRVKAAIDILLGRDVDENGECHFNSIYVVKYRNAMILSLGAHLFHHKIRLEFAKEIIKKMCQDAGFSDIKKPLDTLEDTYRKGYKGAKLRGKSGLIDLFKIADINGENEVRAKGRLAKLNDAFGFNINKNSKTTGFPKFGSLNEADLIVEAARKRIDFAFISHLKQPFAVIKVNNFVEVQDMSDKDSGFMDTLRMIWRDENLASGNSRKTTIPEDKLTQARLALISEIRRL